MGLCCCTMICPVGLCTGTSIAASLSCSGQHAVLRRRLWKVFLALTAIGFFVLYLPLTILCANMDNESWTLWRGEGVCWSEGGPMPYTILGFLAGLAMGIGVSGILTLLVAAKCCSAATRYEQHLGAEFHDDPEKQGVVMIERYQDQTRQPS